MLFCFQNSLRFFPNSIEAASRHREDFRAGEPLLNLLRPSGAVTNEQTEGGWSRMMNSKLTKEQVEKLDLEKYLGKRGWTDPSEWL